MDSDRGKEEQRKAEEEEEGIRGSERETREGESCGE